MLQGDVRSLSQGPGFEVDFLILQDRGGGHGQHQDLVQRRPEVDKVGFGHDQVLLGVGQGDLGLEHVVHRHDPKLILVLGNAEMLLEVKDILLGHFHHFLGPEGFEVALGHRQKDVVPGLGRVQETGLMALDGRHIFGRGAPEVEEQLVHGGLAAPEVPVGLGKAGAAGTRQAARI